MSINHKVAITTGDVDGIGFEVAVKSLLKIGPQKNYTFYLWRSHRSDRNLVKNLEKKFDNLKCSSFSEAEKKVSEVKKVRLVEIVSEQSPALWVQDVAQLCMENKIDSMVTGPLSKPAILDAGLKDMGHTDILKRISSSQHAFMAFIGRYFNVILTTGHIPLEDVSRSLTPALINKALSIALDSRKLLSSSQRKKPVGILGLNPHAGDSGLIGNFEFNLKTNIQQNKSIKGPLVPDVAFLRSQWALYSFYLALYHDQGLIPFKTVHGFDSGVHITLGLPIRRTSVDHGTAKDIFGKNKANPGSMTEAIKWGMRLCTIQ